MMDFNKIFQSKVFKSVLGCIAVIIVVILVLKIGMMIGFKKAEFSYRWGENYHRNFAGPRGGFFKDFEGEDFIDAHGVVGQIIKIDMPTTIIIKGKDGIEKIVVIKDDTVIKNLRDTVRLENLKIDDMMVVIGQPNEDGQIEAKLIRILPPPPQLLSFNNDPFNKSGRPAMRGR